MTPNGPLSTPPDTAQLFINNLSPFPKQFKAAHVNAQSLRCHVDEIRAIFGPQNFDIIAVSESWLKPYIPSSEVTLQGYQLFRNDRLQKTGGGVAVYVKDCIKVKHLFSTPQEYTAKPEFIFLEIILSVSDVLLLGVCYRPPRVGHLADFENTLLRLLPGYSHVLIMGDFNTNLLNNHNHEYNQLTRMFQSCNLTILPLNATHHTAGAATLLDLMVVSDPDESVLHGQLPIPAVSRHDLIYCVLSLRAPKQQEKFLTFRQFRNMNEAEFLADVYSSPWHSIVLKDTVDEMVDSLNSQILNLYDKHAPTVTRRINKKRPVPWLTGDILALMARRDSVFRRARRSQDAELMSQYRRLRNQVKQKLRNSRLRYINSLFSERNQSTTTLWRNVKKLGFGKQPSPVPINIPLNVLNDYFLSLSHSSNSPHVQSYLSEITQENAINLPSVQFHFKPVLQIDVLRAIHRISSNATGTDKISITLIKKILFAILPVLTSIFNTSLKTGMFPQKWKYALVRPLNKVPSPSQPQDYRPISILPALSKGLERIVHTQISEFFAMNNIINVFQSGFRQQHSTETALLKVTDDIRLAMDRSQCTLLTLFDFSKAFDTVNHNILLAKLYNLGFAENPLSWVKSYLSGRRQCVCHDNVTSDYKTVTCGVPQGSILGPLLFTVYVNDISTVLRHTKFHSYADDLQIYAHFNVNDMDETVDMINSDIERLVQWTVKHGLKLNPDKTKPLIVGNQRLLSTIDLNTLQRITVNGTLLPYCDKVKSLGLIVNNTLGWTDAVVNTCNRVFVTVHSLKRIQRLLPFHIKLFLVKTLVFPHFNYCCAVINDMTVALSTKLQRTQNYCIRFLFNLRRDDHVTPYYIQCSLLKLSELRVIRILMLTHSVLKTGYPKYLAENFQFLAVEGVRNTRSGSSTLRIPIHRTTAYNRSFTVTACRTWNALPASIRGIESRSRFAAELKTYYLNQMIAAVDPAR